MKLKNLNDMRVAIWGLGVEGKAVLEVLNKTFPGKEITIIDDNSTEKLKNVDIVIRSPGVSIYKPEIIEAKKNGVIFTTEKTLFLDEINNNGEKPKTIAITGTKGKTTTATFFAFLLEKLGYKTLLAGNMGVPTIKLIDEAKKSDFVVLELSSYQTSDLMANVDIGIILNLFPEHIDWHGTHDNYYNDKMNLNRNAVKKIINGIDGRILKSISDENLFIKFNTDRTIHYKEGYFYDGDKKLFSTTNMKLLGEHNYQNLCSVFTALKFLEIDLNRVKQEYLDEFQPVKHRMETFTINNILHVNDSISTTPETAIAGYKTFSHKNIYGILGGFDREQDYTELVNYIVKSPNIKYLSLVGQTKSTIAELLEKKGFDNFHICETLEDCVDVLYKKAVQNKNSAIILSPAAPSYDMFKNFEERGDLFRKIAENQ